MSDFGSAIVSIIISIGIFWYIYDARRTYRQKMNQYAAARHIRSTYGPPERTLILELKAVDDLDELDTDEWQYIRRNPFQSSSSMIFAQRPIKSIQPCYRRSSRPPQCT